MPFYPDAQALYGSLRDVFTHIEQSAPVAYQAFLGARLALRLKCSEPAAEVLLDGRRLGRFQATYGPAAIRPDMDVELATDTLHLILLDQLTVKRAVANGLVKVRGPAWKLSALGHVMEAGRLVYPEVLRKNNLM